MPPMIRKSGAWRPRGSKWVTVHGKAAQIKKAREEGAKRRKELDQQNGAGPAADQGGGVSPSAGGTGSSSPEGAGSATEGSDESGPGS